MQVLEKNEIKAFERWMINQRKSHLTVRQYSFFLDLFLEYIGKPVNEITPDDIELFKGYLVDKRKYSKNSQYLCMKALKLFYRSQRLQIPYNLTSPRRPQSVPKYLTEKEMARLLAETRSNTRNFAIISVLAYTGIRVGELCRLNLEDVDIDEDVVRVRHGKGDKDRIVIMTEECAASVRDYLRIRPVNSLENDALFISRKMSRIDPSTVQRMVKTVAVRAGITKTVTPHVLRHTFATSILRNGASIRFIQELLGHSSVATTQIYTHIDDNAMRELYEKHKPAYTL